MAAPPTVRILPVTELDQRSRQAIISLCSAAFDEDFGQVFELLPGSIHALAERDGALVGHACWVTRWLQPAGLAPLQTAYIEAVATAPPLQRQGIGSVIMWRVALEIAGHQLGALSPTYPAFYERLGWEAWRGPLAIRSGAGLIETPDEGLMIRRAASTPPLDLDSPLTAEWRPGELW